MKPSSAEAAAAEAAAEAEALAECEAEEECEVPPSPLEEVLRGFGQTASNVWGAWGRFVEPDGKKATDGKMSGAERVAAEAAAAAQVAADAAIAEVEAAQLDPDDPLNAARLQLEEALRAAVAMQRGMGAPVAPRCVASLEAAIAEAADAGVGGEQLRNARERLEDCRAEAALEMAEYTLTMATRRANMASFGRAQMSELVRALGEATEAGVDPALIRSARKLVSRKGNEKEAQIVKLYDRLDRFKRMAAGADAASEGERENTERMLAQAQEKLAKLMAPEAEEEEEVA